MNNIRLLSEDNKNYIFIDNTILEELNRKKESRDWEVKYQAKKFVRLANNNLGNFITFENLPNKIQKIIIKKEKIKKEKDWTQYIISLNDNNQKEEYNTGQKKFAIKHGDKLEYCNFDNNEYLEYKYKNIFVKPINLEQKFYFEILTDDRNKITVCSGSTGSGKTLIALQAGIDLVKRNKVEGITYTRNTVTTTDSQSEMGYRKGGEKEKLDYFMKPLYNAISKTINEARGEKNTIVSDEEILEFMKTYNIKVIDIAHMRGITLDNEFVIVDETQNMGNPTLKLTGTRIGENSRILYLGDVGQVDHLYLSENRNALATLLDLATKHNEISGIKLIKTIRSEIAEFHDKIL